MRDPNHPAAPQELDDVDRVFARLERAAVPETLTARVLATTVVSANALAWPWMAAVLAALGLLSLAGYQLGVSLAAGDGLEVVAALFEDLGLFLTAPGDVLAALGEVIPWSLIVLAGIGGGVLVLAAGHLLSRSSASLRGRQTA